MTDLTPRYRLCVRCGKITANVNPDGLPEHDQDTNPCTDRRLDLTRRRKAPPR